MESKTLRELVDEYGANGVIRIDAGNGSAGPMWIEWDDETDEQIGDVEMIPVNDPEMDSDARLVMDDPTYHAEYASEWIEDDDRNAPYRATNPYRYRLIF